MSSTTANALPHVTPDATRRKAGWRFGAYTIAAIVLVPLLSIVFLSFAPEENIWPHLASTVLPRYITTTLLLMLGVGIGVLLLGVPAAWFTSMCDFPGRRIFEILLLLPLAIPAYVIAYLYTDLLEYAGPVQGALRHLGGWQTPSEYWFPEIRSLGGAICMMSLVLYPYVYLMTRSSLLQMSPRMLEAGRILGMPPSRVFFRVVVPIIRPALAVGVSLALMETLNDYGTVNFFSVQTLSAGVYDVWLNMGNLGGAAQIASVMLTFVLLLIVLERMSRRRREYFQSDTRKQTFSRFRLRGWKLIVAWLMCLGPALFGFIVPATELVFLAASNFSASWTQEFRSNAVNSLVLSSLAAVIAVGLAVVIAYAQRLHADRPTKIALFVSSIGYAIPGAVLAIGVLIPLAAFDNAFDSFMRDTFDISTGLLLSGTIFAVLAAYVIRFLAISVGAVESSLSTIKPSMEMAARSLGYSAGQTLRRFHLPLIRPGLITALVIVFVDSMKELPATLILRPFDFDTLAVQVFHQAGDEMIELAALPALVIVGAGLLPVILLTRIIKR